MRKQNKNLVGREADAWAEELWGKVLESIHRAKSKNETKKFLENLLSPIEKKMLLRRLAISVLLRSGKSYREIGKILWVSPQTISAIKKSYYARSGGYRSDRSMRKNKNVKTIENQKDSALEDFIFNFIGLPVKVWEGFFTKGLGVLGRENDFDY